MYFINLTYLSYSPNLVFVGVTVSLQIRTGGNIAGQTDVAKSKNRLVA